MIIDCISDLHGNYPKLEGGDILIVAGDLTTTDSLNNWHKFYDWMEKQKYTRKIYIGGNHDNFLEKTQFESCAIYLQDSGTEFEGMKIWGSPWSLSFDGINPKCKAFTFENDEELSKKWDLIPDDIDILITHIPPNGVLDGIQERNKWGGLYDIHVGSTSLRNLVISNKFPNLKLHVFGHIHEWGGKQITLIDRTFVNASYVNEVYDPTNSAIRIEL